MKSTKFLLSFFSVLLLANCATMKTQISNNFQNSKINKNNTEIAHSFYLIGDAGNSAIGSTSEALNPVANWLLIYGHPLVGRATVATEPSPNTWIVT